VGTRRSLPASPLAPRLLVRWANRVSNSGNGHKTDLLSRLRHWPSFDTRQARSSRRCVLSPIPPPAPQIDSRSAMIAIERHRPADAAAGSIVRHISSYATSSPTTSVSTYGDVAVSFKFQHPHAYYAESLVVRYRI
jgi:hypothetical protein